MWRAYWMIVVLCGWASPGRADEAPYTLNPGDSLLISSFDDERLNREVVVLPDGTVSYPVVGQIETAGKTVHELENIITQVLVEKKFLQEGSLISVAVTKATGNTIYVIGQVKQPGAYTTFARVDVMQALTLAGGLTPFASKSGIKVIRQQDGKTITLPFDYGDVEDGEALEANIILRTGDVVIVPD